MSQPPHLLQETKGLGVKCRLLRQHRGVERVDCRGGSSCEGRVDVYLLVSEGQKSTERNGGEGEKSKRVVGSQFVVECKISSGGSKSGVVFFVQY